MTFYGTESETCYCDRYGRYWLVQGPDMRDSEPVRLDAVPDGAEQIDAPIDFFDVARVLDDRPATLTETVRQALATYHNEFPGEPLDDPWFTAAWEIESGGVEWDAYWAECLRQEDVRRLNRFYALREASGGLCCPGGLSGALLMQRETQAMRSEGLVSGCGPTFGLTAKGREAWEKVRHG